MRKILLLSLLLLVPLCGCSRMEYDTAGGRLNKNVTLFRDGISVPIGKIGPVTVADLLNGSEIEQFLLQYAKIDLESGLFYLETTQDFYIANAFEAAYKCQDSSQPYHWELGDFSGNVDDFGGALTLFRLKFPDQRLTVRLTSPMNCDVVLNGSAGIECRAAFTNSYEEEKTWTDFPIPQSYNARTLAEFELPADVTDFISELTLSDMAIDFPAGFGEQIRSDGNGSFKFISEYTSHIGPGADFQIGMERPLRNLGLKIGRFGLHRCQVSFEIENSLPLDVTLNALEVLDAEGRVLEDITVSSGIHVSGGTLDAPAVTPVTLEISAKNFTIPDLDALRVSFTVRCAPGKQHTPLSTRMGVCVKSSSVTLSGGITIPFHE